MSALTDILFEIANPAPLIERYNAKRNEYIKQHGSADLAYTLNTIDLNRPEGFALSSDGYRRDAFYRFNQSLQHFFDSSAKIDTQFAVGANA